MDQWSMVENEIQFNNARVKSTNAMLGSVDCKHMKPPFTIACAIIHVGLQSSVVRMHN